MREDQNKQKVLDVLRQQQLPIKLSELLLKLGSDYSERTVRRWLSDLEKIGLIVKLGQKRATQYRVVDDGLELEAKESFFQPESQKIIEKIQRPYALRNPVAYN